MKKYLYTAVFVMSLVYSCTNQNTVNNQNKPTAISTEQLATAKTLYDARCGKCHDLPATTDYTQEEWKPIIEKMAPKAKLTEEETNWVLAYVNNNAKK